MTEAIRRLPYSLRAFCAVAGCSAGITVAIVLVAQWRGLPYPYSWPLIKPFNLFWDYSDYFYRFQLLHQSRFFVTGAGYPFSTYPFTYMAPGAVLYNAFYSFGLVGGLIAYLVAALALVLLGFAKLRQEMLRRGVAVASVDGFSGFVLLTSYPIAFCIARGNLEIMVAAGLAVGTWAYWRGRSWTAAILWGVFGSVKLYPLLLIAVFLSKREYRQFLAAISAAAVTTLLSLWYVGPNLFAAAVGIRSGLAGAIKIYALAYDRWLGYDHSLFALIKIGVRRYQPDLASLLHSYFIVLGGVMLAVYFVRIRRLPVANQLLILTICSIVLPPMSFDYSLVQLYVPFLIMVVLLLDAERPMPGVTALFCIFALVFTPTNFLFHHGEGMSAQLKCLLLSGLFLTALSNPFGERKDVKAQEELEQPA